MSRHLFTPILLVLTLSSPVGSARPPNKVTPTEAGAFVTKADAELRRLWVAQSKADWAKQTNITPETEAAAAAAGSAAMTWITSAIKKARRFESLLGTGRLAPEVERQLVLLRVAGQPAPDDAVKTQALAEVMAGMDAEFGKAKACDPAGRCRDLGELDELLSTVASQGADPAALETAWRQWHDTIGRTLAPMYPRFVELANEGARAIGYLDVGHMWRSGYDMTPDEFEATYRSLWEQVKPLYAALHCYVRRRLTERFGEVVVPKDRPIPAHLLGNMWAQDWTYLFPLLEPFPGRPRVDATPALVAQGYDAVRMVKLAETFFTSLGMDPLPKTFWERSMFVKPEGREVVCHASAWDVEYANDLRIKMCIEPNHSDLITIHHELGHNYYYNHYYTAPVLFQTGANDGFHEAIGDTLALSVTPAYLKQVGLLDSVPADDEGAVNQLMYLALDKVAFLPWGLLVDQWRWDVFSGRTGPADYTARWWELRRELQGVAPSGDRGTEGLFDPGAKYHVASNTPYARYFLSTILQFQFHRALCKARGHTGPLHTCSIYGSSEAGKPLREMLRLGASRPWQEALSVVAPGERAMDPGALLAYFAPLKRWLDAQNEGHRCGW